VEYEIHGIHFLNEKLVGPDGHVMMYELAKRATTSVKLNTTFHWYALAFKNNVTDFHQRLYL
jgi:hypothetical protein